MAGRHRSTWQSRRRSAGPERPQDASSSRFQITVPSRHQHPWRLRAPVKGSALHLACSSTRPPLPQRRRASNPLHRRAPLGHRSPCSWTHRHPCRLKEGRSQRHHRPRHRQIAKVTGRPRPRQGYRPIAARTTSGELVSRSGQRLLRVVRPLQRYNLLLDG